MANEQPRPDVDITALTAFLDSLQSFSVDLVLNIQPGQSLYHYTDLGGLLGIVQNHDLWLTHSRYSNDDEEMTLGYKVVGQIIRAELDKPGATVDRIAYLRRLAELVEKPTPEGVYICCFCMKDNLLSQWRSYGANGTGVSLKFDPVGFTPMTGYECKHGLLRFWKVFYRLETQMKIITDAINFVPAQNIGQTTEALALRAADAIQFFIPTFKNADFSEEEEWRLIFTPQPSCPVKPRYRVARNMLVPYYTLRDLTKHLPPEHLLPIRGVCVGPSAQKSLNVESTRMILTQSRYGNAPVIASETPYRG